MKSFKTHYLTETSIDVGSTFNYWSYSKGEDQRKEKEQRLLNFIAKIENKKGDWKSRATASSTQGSFSKKFMTKIGDVVVHPEFAQDLKDAFKKGDKSSLVSIFKRFEDGGRTNLVPLEYKENRKLVSIDDLMTKTKNGELPLSQWTMKLSNFTKTDWDFGGVIAKSHAKAAIELDTKGGMPATGKFDSTKFEANICYGCTRRWAEANGKWGIKPLVGNKGTGHDKAFRVLNEKAAFNGTTIETKQINFNLAAMEAGYKLAKNLGIAEKANLPTKKYGLDTVYTKYGAISDTLKTDIIVGGKAVSIKNQKNAQLATPTSGEAAAIFHYACEKTPSDNFNPEVISALMYKVLSNRGFSSSRVKFGGKLDAPNFDQFMTKVLHGDITLAELKKGNDNLMKAISPELQSKIASEVASMEGDFRSGLRSSTVEAWMLKGKNHDQYDNNKEVHNTIFNYLKNKTTFYDDKSEKTIENHSKVGNLPKAAFVQFFATAPESIKKKVTGNAKNPIIDAQIETVKAVWLMPMPEINEKIMNYLDEPALHEYMMWEMATGFHKFRNTLGSATDMLTWTTEGTGTYHPIGGPHGAYAKKLAKCISWRIGDRGRPIDPIPGFGKVKKGSIRMSIGKACFKEEVLSCNEKAFGNDFVNLNEEENKWCEDFGEAYADGYIKTYLAEHTEEQLLENWLGDLGKGLRSMGKKAVDWGKQVIADFTEMIKSALRWLASSIGKVVTMVNKAFGSSTLAAMRMFEIGHIVSIQIT